MNVRVFKLHQWAEIIPVDVTRFSGVDLSMQTKTVQDYSPVGKMLPVATVPPGTPSRKVKIPTRAARDLDEYYRKTNDLNFPLTEAWAWEGICPECNTESIIARDDYICVTCRNA